MVSEGFLLVSRPRLLGRSPGLLSSLRSDAAASPRAPPEGRPALHALTLSWKAVMQTCCALVNSALDAFNHVYVAVPCMDDYHGVSEGTYSPT